MRNFIVGFTGTREGLTLFQAEKFAWFFSQPDRLKVGYFVHGDCVGADAQVHKIVLKLGIHVRKRPSNIWKFQAKSTGGLTIADPEDPLVRNRKIVEGTDFLLACPKGPEIVRSGTWSTIRYAKKIGKDIFVILPDGSSYSNVLIRVLPVTKSF